MLYAVQFILSFFASAGFGILFNAPRRTILAGGMSGAFGWLMYFIATENDIQAVIASFLGAIVLTALSIMSSRKLRAPIIIFITCGIIPLVPGGLAYNAMRSVVLENYDMALAYGFQVALVSLAIAMGIISTEMIDSLFQTLKRKVKNMRKKEV
ncbi:MULTISPECIES: threonine/serine exporter family protein [Jeotgalicoccus]|uniref:threonine/serine exporter family protein n=1 Tax=Jeotgalicoccus TaxID=227979 RepID=UPI0004175AF8|nr:MULTISPECIES: threonine/serine exporter family protein [Jeotgalicoccus]